MERDTTKYGDEVHFNKSVDATLSKLGYDRNETYSKDLDAQAFEKTPNSLSVADNTCQQVSVFDVASYILYRLGKPCSTMKLHKLLYYCQAWNLVWAEKPLFPQSIEAWANGPVIRELFNYHKGLYELTYNSFLPGNKDKLSKEQKDNVDIVLQSYGSKSAQWLVEQTHLESPWINARKGLAPSQRGYNKIQLDDMVNYYSSLK